ncbi:hypothetical protein CI610_03067 [invertebrate metagenome]|uniref:non-specific serine/threonine protein kinase n=1 Tax=invertebrate metagenome TaxID=1711999 RepID=A0A2H9T469_9ZZZZ
MPVEMPPLPPAHIENISRNNMTSLRRCKQHAQSTTETYEVFEKRLQQQGVDDEFEILGSWIQKEWTWVQKRETEILLRKDKNTHHLPFTLVFSLMAHDHTYEYGYVTLLNSVPHTVLVNFGWSPEDISKLEENYSKCNFWTASQWHYLNIPKPVTLNQEFYYILGDSNFAKVKFALITQPSTTDGSYKLCAAKKITMRAYRKSSAFCSLCTTIERIKDFSRKIIKEYNMQTRANSIMKGRQLAPSVYGCSATLDKRGNYQGIIFMDIAKGINAQRYIKMKKRENSLHESARLTISHNLLDVVEHMHNAGMTHGDLSTKNFFINPNTLQIQLIDFGKSNTVKTQKLVYPYTNIPPYWAPEWLKDKEIDTKAAEIYSLAVILIDFLCFGLIECNPFFPHSRSFQYPFQISQYDQASTMIKEYLARITFPDEATKTLICRMLNPLPNLRPTIQEVRREFNHLFLLSTGGQEACFDRL